VVDFRVLKYMILLYRWWIIEKVVDFYKGGGKSTIKGGR
jgi:hypothetical protein